MNKPDLVPGQQYRLEELQPTGDGRVVVRMQCPRVRVLKAEVTYLGAVGFEPNLVRVRMPQGDVRRTDCGNLTPVRDA